jgi:hypothetical protein
MSTFVSYAREDRDIALRLTEDLRTAGIDVWIDQRDIRAGEQWDQAVERALEQSPTMLVILSPDAVQSHSVMDEVSYALEERKRVVPVLHRPCKIPLRMRRLQYVELTPAYDDALSRLVTALQSGSAPAVVDPARTPAPTPTRRPGLRAAVFFGLFGAVYGAIASYLIFLHDPRFTGRHESLDKAVVQGGIVLAILGAIAGFVSGGRRRSVLAALIGCAAATLLWVLIGGTYEDVVWAGVLFGGGFGAILAAGIARAVRR